MASWCLTVVTNCLHALMLKYQVISCDVDPRMKMETCIIIGMRSNANSEIASDGQSLLDASSNIWLSCPKQTQAGGDKLMKSSS